MPLTDFITKWGREHTLPFDAHILNKPHTLGHLLQSHSKLPS